MALRLHCSGTYPPRGGDPGVIWGTWGRITGGGDNRRGSHTPMTHKGSADSYKECPVLRASLWCFANKQSTTMIGLSFSSISMNFCNTLAAMVHPVWRQPAAVAPSKKKKVGVSSHVYLFYQCISLSHRRGVPDQRHSVVGLVRRRAHWALRLHLAHIVRRLWRRHHSRLP